MAIQRISFDLEQSVAQVSIEDLVDCQSFAEQLALVIQVPLAIGLSGTLGAGKTQWTRYFAMALGAPGKTISSPTFMLVHQYASKPPIFHLDAYRIGDEDEMLELGIEEMFDAEAITVVEWSDRFPDLLPRNTLRLHFEIGEALTARVILLKASGKRGKDVMNKLMSDWP